MPRKIQNSFLFASLNDNKISTTRKVHLRRLADLLYVCIHKRDWQRAGRAWGILTRCHEFKWKTVWQFGIIFASTLAEESKASQGVVPVSSKSLEYLRVLMLRLPQQRVVLLQEIIIQLIDRGEHRQALEQLELYLPSYPYHEDITLNIYAVLLHLYLSFQFRSSASSSQDETNARVQTHLSECRGYLRRASELGKDHPMLNHISAWLESNMSQSYYHRTDGNASESDDDTTPKKNINIHI